MPSSLTPAFSVVVPLRALKLLVSNFSPDVVKLSHVHPRQRSVRIAYVFGPDFIATTMSVPGPKPPISKRVRFYAVRQGRNGFTGILKNWEEAKALTSGVSHADYKSFKTLEHAEAFLKIPKPSQSTTPRTRVTTTGPSPINTVSSTPITNGTLNSPRIPVAPPEPEASSLPIHELYASTNAHQLAKDAPDPSDESPKELVVYTDGACSKNGGLGAKAGYGVYFGEENPYNVSEPLPQLPTNQRAEMTAVLEAMRITLDHGLVANKGKLVICTDSQYTISGLTSWMARWKSRCWKTASGTAVKNKEIWVAMDACKEALKLKGIDVILKWVKGHSNVPGNEAADRLAVAAMDRS